MASIQEEEHVVSREKEKVVKSKKAIPTNKKPIDKTKIIVFSVFAFIVILVFTFVGLSLKSDEKTENVEIEIPISEEEKYNSKLQAVGESDKKQYTQDVDLENTYNNTNQQNQEDQEALKKQINKMEADSKKTQNYENEPPPPPQKKKTRSYSNTTYTQYQEPPTPKKTSSVSKEVVEEDYSSGFFKKKNTAKESQSNKKIVLYACVHTDQVIYDGSRVKMRLTKSVTIENETFPINTILYGIAKISPNRLNVIINKINQTNVNLQIYDAEDSNPGIYVLTPNLNEVLKNGVKEEADNQDETLNKIPFSKTLQNLLSKKLKQENIQLLNNYKLIIKNEKKFN